MPTFAFMGFDKANALDIRVATRSDHLAYMKDFGAQIRYGGPLLDENEAMCGSLIVVETPDRAAAEAIFAGDPYRAAGLFERTELLGLRPVLGQP